MVTRFNNPNSKRPYKSKRWKFEPNVTIGDTTYNITFMCDRCNIPINQVPNDKDLYMCSRCKRTFLPDIEQVKRDLPFSNPDEENRQVEPAVTSVGFDEYYGHLKPKKNELKWGAKSLSQKGTIRFTDYREG